MFEFMRYPKYFNASAGSHDAPIEEVTAESIAIAAAITTIHQFNQACEVICNETSQKDKQ